MAPVFDVHRFESRDRFDAALAERIARACAGPAAQASAVMLTGGSTPAAAYRQVAAMRPVPAAELRVLYSDDRYVPSDDAASNYRLSRGLIEALGLSGERVLRVRTELPLAEAASDYEAQIARLQGAGIVIGFALLGLGADGHIASLFSPQDLERARGRLAIAVHRPDGRDAVSVTPSVLVSARELLLAVSGADKRAAVAALLRGNPAIVASHALAACPRVELWVDAEAHPQERVHV